ncbi:TPA: YfjI family protein [Providencia alcalifaciens]
MKHFPLNAFPVELREAILDIEELTQAPIPLIASSVISAISLSCQNLINVEVNEKMKTPVSLFLFVIANSGERKTTVDRIVMNPFYQHDKNSLHKFDKNKEIYSIELKVWETKEKAILGVIKKKTVKGQPTELEFQRLRELQIEKPFLPKCNRLIYNNTTPEALQFAMYNHSPNIGLIADEGANILDRQVMKDLSFINSMWDGVSFNVERKTTQSFTIEDGRITLSMMVQKKPFDLYLKRQGEKARGSGFFARCLPVFIDEHLSTQGERFIRPHSNEQENLSYFHQRINELLMEDEANIKARNREIISLDTEAQYEWELIYNKIEHRINPDEIYANMNDFASKLPNNVARLSALLSYFTEGNCAIKKEYIQKAWLLCEWYMEQAINLFSHEGGYYEALLLSWLDMDYERSNTNCIKFNDIRRFGPNALRKGELLNIVVNNLESVNAIEIDYTRGGAKMVYKGKFFRNNKFTKNPVISHY